MDAEFPRPVAVEGIYQGEALGVKKRPPDTSSMNRIPSWATSKPPDRVLDSEQIIFWHRSFAISDIAVSKLAYDRAIRSGLGQRLTYYRTPASTDLPHRVSAVCNSRRGMFGTRIAHPGSARATHNVTGNRNSDSTDAAPEGLPLAYWNRQGPRLTDLGGILNHP